MPSHVRPASRLRFSSLMVPMVMGLLGLAGCSNESTYCKKGPVHATASFAEGLLWPTWPVSTMALCPAPGSTPAPASTPASPANGQKVVTQTGTTAVATGTPVPTAAGAAIGNVATPTNTLPVTP